MNLDAHLTCTQAAHIANVTRHVVLMWRNRGWLDPTTGERHKLAVVGEDDRGNPTYRLRDIQAAERATRRSGKSHRRNRSMLTAEREQIAA